MRQHIRELLSFGVGLGAMFFCSIPGFAGSAPRDWMNAERFRELPWEATMEKAKTVFQDLTFVRYAIVCEKETPSIVYERKNEEKTIDGVRVDEILYWFRNDSFYKVTATLWSKVGPRTLETPAADAYDRLRNAISRAAGPPAEKRGAMVGNRKGVWQHGDVSIALSCLDPPGVNGEELVLEIVKREAPKIQVPE